MGAIEIVGLEWLGALALFLGFILLVRYLDHRERMAMIDRGLIPPQRIAQQVARAGSAVLRGGLITAMVGLAVTIGLYTLGYLLPPPFSAVPGKVGPWLLPGLIPLGVGLALIVNHYLAPPHAATDDGATKSATPVASEQSAHAADPQRAGLGWRILGRSVAAIQPVPEDYDQEQEED
jgi:hypothetical protein